MFLRGDKPTIYRLLNWMLNKLPDLKKRAYLARFLKEVPVPEEFLAEPSMD